jgi:hypothetical protein
MKIAVIDGQGGGIGKLLVEKLRKEFPDNVQIIALGTNALAVSSMIKAGANAGASGENAIVYNAGRVDLIIGPLGIIIPNAMLGEITHSIANSILTSNARKILLPLNKCGIDIAGIKNEPLQSQIDELVLMIKEHYKLIID